MLAGEFPRGKIPRYYELADELAGRLLKRLPEDTEVLVVSDHGNQLGEVY
jgi:predicted AlkP superfamily phosphohydrolase/phosphomutase